jgi:RNA polymerase sigma-70 factor (ECF subfamily)
MRRPLDRTSVTDEVLMACVQENDTLAFAQLYGRHAERARMMTHKICRDVGRAEEAVQDGFFSIWRSRADYQPRRGSFQAWSMGIVRHRAIDSFRHVGIRPRLQAVVAADGPEEIDTAPSPLSDVIAHGERAHMFELLQRLPENQAEVVVLAFYGGLSHSEIATRLGLPAGTVKGRMRSGLKKLRFEWRSDDGQYAGNDPTAPRPTHQVDQRHFPKGATWTPK